jgi:hypothetical protein
MKVRVDGRRQEFNNWSNNQIAPHIEITADAQPATTKRVTVEVISMQ